jgi:hypothetical protein
MLRLRKVKHLANRLGISETKLRVVIDSADHYCDTLILHDPAKPLKPREVVRVRGDLRQLQSRLFRRLLDTMLKPSEYSHGGVRGRHIISNAEAHRDSSFIFKADISNFYPSIHFHRIYDLFIKQFQCCPDVARLCTRLCTYNHCLSLGLVTSPILADQILKRVDARIGAMCQSMGATYTRFVDDIAISANYDLRESGIRNGVNKILNDDGLRANPAKSKFGDLEDGATITGIRFRRGHLDVQREYVVELERQIHDAKQLGLGGHFVGPYFTEQQIQGRLQFVCWVNPRRKISLQRLFRSVQWQRVSEQALALGLVQCKKRLTAALDRQKVLGTNDDSACGATTCDDGTAV